MVNRFGIFVVAFVLSSLGCCFGAEPTEMRTWNSLAGTKVEAVASKIENGVVIFQTNQGRNLSVPLEKLVDEDQVYLREHFKVPVPKKGEPRGSELSPAGEGLSQELGVISSAIDTGKGSKYLIYLPTTLKSGRQAPLIFWTHSGGGNPNLFEYMMTGADACGWIVAVSVEGRNGNGDAKNHEHTKNCLKHIAENFPVDEDRIYFTGNSGGAGCAYYNAARLPHAGAIGVVGYIAGDLVPKGGDYVFINGAIDWNRSPAAHWAEELGKKNSTLRYYPSGHHSPGKYRDWIVHEAMVLLNAKYLAGKESKLKEELLDFEVGVLHWIAAIKEAAPHRAYHLALLLREELDLSKENGLIFEGLLDELGSPLNKRYVEGLVAMDKFGRDELAPLSQGGALRKHTTPSLQSAAEKLSEKFAGVPEIEETALMLGELTQ